MFPVTQLVKVKLLQPNANPFDTGIVPVALLQPFTAGSCPFKSTPHLSGKILQASVPTTTPAVDLFTNISDQHATLPTPTVILPNNFLGNLAPGAPNPPNLSSHPAFRDSCPFFSPQLMPISESLSLASPPDVPSSDRALIVPSLQVRAPDPLPSLPCSSTTPLGLYIASWNIAGLDAKLLDPTWLSTLDLYDIILLQETWSINQTLNPGYTNYFVPAIPSKSGRNSGGLIIWIRNSLPVTVLQLDINHRDILGLVLHFDSGYDLFIFNIYNRPNPPSQPSQIIQFLSTHLASIRPNFNNNSSTVLVGGDFNCTYEPLEGLSNLLEDEDAAFGIPGLPRGLKAKPSTLAIQILAMTVQHNLRACNGRTTSDQKRASTFHRNSYSSTLDYFLINLDSWHRVLDSTIMQRLESDHDLVSLVLTKPVTDTPRPD